jgi:hypothetical protein|tara:strand:- start:14066 stop:14224 length:159 start_codon:yes stop_codon:yes gene_type:complete
MSTSRWIDHLGHCQIHECRLLDILGKKAEDQPRHEMIHIDAPLGGGPIWIVL